MPEVGIGDGGGIGPGQAAVSLGYQGGHRQAHRHPVIGFAIQLGTVQLPAAVDGHAVCQFLQLGPHRPQLTRHHRQAIGFLHPQFGGAGNAANALGAAGRHR